MTKLIPSLIFLVYVIPVTVAAPQAGAKLEKGVFVVATAQLKHSSFNNTVILITHHSAEKGSMGITINRSTEMTLKQLFPQHHELAKFKFPLYAGGPVQQRSMMILARTQNPQKMEHVVGDIFLGTGIAQLLEIVDNQSNDDVRAYAGYAGWFAGQLEAEIQRGDWLVVPSQGEMIFRAEPEKVWQELINQWSGVWL